MTKLIDRDVLSEPDEAAGFLENILQASTQYSIIGLSADGTIQLWNEGARRLYGYEPQDVVGSKNVAILHTREDVECGKPGEMMALALGEQVDRVPGPGAPGRHQVQSLHRAHGSKERVLRYASSKSRSRIRSLKCLAMEKKLWIFCSAGVHIRIAPQLIRPS